jgi:hypothetical protein
MTNPSLDALFAGYQRRYSSAKKRRAVSQRRVRSRERRITALTKRKALLQERIDATKLPYWLTEICEPLAKALSRSIGRKIEAVGPCGIGCTVHFQYANEKLASEFGTFSIRLLDLETGDLKLVDYDHPINEYPSGTIGAMNGLNYPTVPIPRFEDLVRMLRRRKRQNA